MTQYDAQASFVADKMKEVALIELRSALEKKELKFIKPESIEVVAEIVYWYFKELNRPYGGGMVYCNINNVIETVLTSYKYAIEGKVSTTYLENDDWKELLKETEASFTEKVVGLDLKLEDGILDDISGHAVPHRFVGSPIYDFPYIGNAGAFAIGKKDASGTLVREQYFDKKGNILPESINLCFTDDEWKPSKRIQLI